MSDIDKRLKKIEERLDRIDPPPRFASVEEYAEWRDSHGGGTATAAMMIAGGRSAQKELKAGAPAGRIRELSDQVEAALRVRDEGDHLLFNKVFKKATGFHPFPFQKSMALERTNFHELVKIPTGAGKTAGVILGWIWKRRFASDGVKESTPRRLVYCLPMRVLVEQTYDKAILWLDNLGLLSGRAEWEMKDGEKKSLKRYDPRPQEGVQGSLISVHLLMGGDLDVDWDRYPENDAILIGTQDMLLSRALNRGYSMSRFRWPIHFGLLNNDSLWVMDEVQLMGSGLATSVQLDAFRKKFGVFGRCMTVWMSATCEPEWIETVDRVKPVEKDVLRLGPDDVHEQVLLRRIEATKNLIGKGVILKGTSETELNAYISSLNEIVVESHLNQQSSTEEAPLTLVIVNTVDRAQRLYKSIRESEHSFDLKLIHSRFRPIERRALTRVLNERPGDEGFPKGGRIIIATQVVEAGVDISASTLITELAPWASLVQRFGRLNRYGEHKTSNAIWIDVSTEDEKAVESALPYIPEELEHARGLLERLEGISPAEIERCKEAIPYTTRYVLRRKDLVELFDNTPDLSGNDIDVSRYIRDIRDLDVQVFWRKWGSKEKKPEIPSEDLPRAGREELCSVPINSFRAFMRKHDAWLWNYIDRRYVKANIAQLIPGRIYLLHSTSGGYTPEMGWYPEAKDHVEPVQIEERRVNESTGDDHDSTGGTWVTIGEHAEYVSSEMKRIVSSLSLLGMDKRYKDALFDAARYHDIGKAHPVFQTAILDMVEDDEERRKLGQRLWAKSGIIKRFSYRRRYFRHELASALAIQQNPQVLDVTSEEDKDLVTYMIAAHHGKIRLSIRSLPNEVLPWQSKEDSYPEGTRFARGVWEGDIIPRVELGEGKYFPETVLDLSLMELGMHEEGKPTWLDRTIRLRDGKELGLFKLGYLEALLRVADWRGSGRKDPAEHGRGSS